jgi:hypothetical protein
MMRALNYGKPNAAKTEANRCMKCAGFGASAR